MPYVMCCNVMSCVVIRSVLCVMRCVVTCCDVLCCDVYEVMLCVLIRFNAM